MLTPMTYVVVFVVGFVLAVLTTPLSAVLGRRLGWTDRPGGRRAHQGEISRLGGIALCVGFVGAGLLVFALSALGVWPAIGAEDRKLLTGVLLGSVAVFVFGLADDYRHFRPGPSLPLSSQRL